MKPRSSVAGRARRFFAARFSRDGTLGLSLTVGLIILTVLGWAFGEITEAVVKGDDLAAIDSPVTRWLVEHRSASLTGVMRAVTQLGSAWFVIALLVGVTATLVARHAPRGVVLVAPLSAAGAALLVTTVKLLIARPRPTIGAVVAVANGFSFPSGHSAQAVATYGALAWVVAHGLTRPRARVGPWVVAAVVVLLIGLTRLYLGVHWLSDVIGGYTIGACWLVLVLTAVTTTQRVRGAGRSATAQAGGSDEDVS